MMNTFREMKQEMKREVRAVRRRCKWRFIGYWTKLLAPIVLLLMLFGIVKYLRRRIVRCLKRRAKEKKAQEGRL